MQMHLSKNLKGKKMKANECSIGNWVIWLGKPCKVDTGMLITEFPFKVTQSDNVKLD